MKTKSTLCVIFFLAGVIFFAGSNAWSRGPMQDMQGPEGMEGHRKPPHEIMDTNNDGQVSLEEWSAFHDALFNEIDANGDGVLSEEEFRAHGPGRRGR